LGTGLAHLPIDQWMVGIDSASYMRIFDCQKVK